MTNILSKTGNKSEKIKKNKLSEKNFTELKKYFQQIINNFGEVKNEDKIFQDKKKYTQNFVISNFRKILNRRANNGEIGIIFLFKEIKKNKKLGEFFHEDFLFAEKILDTNSKIFKMIKFS